MTAAGDRDPPGVAPGEARLHTERRNRMLRLGIASSGASKASAFLLQAIAIPLVYRTLGQHQYALYLLLVGVLNSMSLMQFGAGPGIAQGITRAFASGDRRAEAGYFACGLYFNAASALAAALVVFTLVRLFSPAQLFGASFAADRGLILSITNWALGIMTLTISLDAVEATIHGYQEQALVSLSSFSANLVTLALLLWVCAHRPGILGILIASYGVLLLARLGNLGLLLWRRPYLAAGLLHPGWGVARRIFANGLAFWVFQLGGILEQQAPIFLLARFSTTEATSSFGVAYKMVVLAGTAIGLFTQPLWPAMTDAMARGDANWIHRALARLRQLTLALGLLASVSLILFGRWLLPLLLHTSFTGERRLIVLLALYLFANMWTHVHYVVLQGMYNLWHLAGIIMLENLLMVAFGALLVRPWGAAGMALAFLLAALVLPVWLLPYIAARQVRGLGAAPA